MKVFRPYIYGRKFTLQTDNTVVTYIMNNKDTSSKLFRWALKLQEYEFDIIHKKGKTNAAADALSRNPIIATITSNHKRKQIKRQETELPKFDKYKIISELHCELGHANARKTYDQLKDFFFWRSMREDVDKVIKSCEQCQFYNNTNRKKSYYPLLIGEAFERIGIDLMEPLPVTKKRK
jgi:hypothetical protein